MIECVTYPDLLELIEATEPLFNWLCLLAGYGFFAIGRDILVYVDRVWLGHVEPCPCSLSTRSNTEGEV